MIADAQRGRQQQEQEQGREARGCELSVADELDLIIDRDGLARAVTADVAAGRTEWAGVDVLGLDLAPVDDRRTRPPSRRSDRDDDRRGRREREERAEGA